MRLFLHFLFIQKQKDTNVPQRWQISLNGVADLFQRTRCIISVHNVSRAVVIKCSPTYLPVFYHVGKGAGGPIGPLLSICNVFRFVHQDVDVLQSWLMFPYWDVVRLAPRPSICLVFLCSHVKKTTKKQKNV